MRVCTGSMSGARWCRRSISSRRSSTIPIAYGRIAGGERAVGRLRHGRTAAHRARDRGLPQGRRSRDPRRHLQGRPRRRCTRPAWRCSAVTRCRTRRSSSATRSPARSIRRGCWTNAGARAGDRLFLTKAIGTGVIATAIKFDRAPQAAADAAIASMVTLNRAAAEALAQLPDGAVHACTDVTGFGLMGHGTEMAQASGVVVAIDVAAVPFLDGRARSGRREHPGRRPHQPASTSAGASRPPPGWIHAVSSCSTTPRPPAGLLVAIRPDAADAAVAGRCRAPASSSSCGGSP